MGKITKFEINKIANTIFLGELSLDGKINRINGVLPMCIEAKELGIKVINEVEMAYSFLDKNCNITKCECK